MRHKVKIKKFRGGVDANKMLYRKLIINFLNHGVLTTTLKKAKAVRPYLEKIISRSRKETEVNKNYLMKYLNNNKKLVKKCFSVIGKSLEKINGGYVRIVKLLYRQGDGAEKARIEWAHPIIEEEKKNEKKLKEKQEKLSQKVKKEDKK